MEGPITIRFIPVGEGDRVEVPTGTGPMGYSTTVNHYLGFLPGKRGKREGWLVYGVHDATFGRYGVRSKTAAKKLEVRKLRR